jgi:hypothetical protein
MTSRIAQVYLRDVELYIKNPRAQIFNNNEPMYQTLECAPTEVEGQEIAPEHLSTALVSLCTRNITRQYDENRIVIVCFRISCYDLHAEGLRRFLKDAR